MIKIEQDILKLKEEVIAVRRQLHRIPEPGLLEHETTAFIRSYLETLGIAVETGVSGTGVTGFLKGKREGKVIAFRADIDALSVEEQTGAEYCSEKQGFMHACGHDGHMAIVLGLAKYMAENKDKLENDVLFIFQPAEEGPGGAEPIVKAGVLEKYNVGCIFGLHIYPEIQEGKIGCKPGPMMAQTGELDIKIKGKSGHGAMPHKSTDAMIAAINTVSALNTVVSRNIDPLEPAVLTVGKLLCGERRNIIAGEAILEGTMRAFNDETYQRIKSRLIKIISGIPDSFECEIEYEVRDMYPAVNNDERLFGLLQAAVGHEDLEVIKPLTISEDFSYYQKAVPGLFFMLGSRNEEKGYTNPIHNNRFNFTEEIMLTGIQVFWNLYNEVQKRSS